jgi:hypothetical protein
MLRHYCAEVRMKLDEVAAHFLYDGFLMLGGDNRSALASDD